MLLQVSFNVFLMKINWLKVDFDSTFFYFRSLESFRLSFFVGEGGGGEGDILTPSFSSS